MPFFTCKDAQGNVVPGKEKVHFSEQPPNPTGKGWTWVEWVQPEPEPPPPPRVPESVNKSQMKAALLMSGHLAAIEAFLAGIPDPQQRALALIGWNDGNVIYRSGSPLVQAAQAHMGWSDEDVDQLFLAAAEVAF